MKNKYNYILKGCVVVFKFHLPKETGWIYTDWTKAAADNGGPEEYGQKIRNGGILEGVVIAVFVGVLTKLGYEGYKQIKHNFNKQFEKNSNKFKNSIKVKDEVQHQENCNDK